MKEPVLVVIKPDGISKGLVGQILTNFAETELEIVALKIKKTSQELAEQHYIQLKDKPFYSEVINYLSGVYHQTDRLLAIIYYGDNAIKQCRKIAGATNPEDAKPTTLRGRFGRIHSSGLIENVVHVSSDKEEAEREIKLWFEPEDITVRLYHAKTKTISHKKRVWV